MTQNPVVYIFHGDDEYAIAENVSELETKVGDPTTAAMNITRIEGSSFSFNNLGAATNAMPFLAERRLVILSDFLGNLNSPSLREVFTSFLEKIPPTTGLILVINHPLVSEKDKRHGSRHWLQKWAEQQEQPVYEREFLLLKGDAMATWIQNRAVELGGSFSRQAAIVLASYVQEDPRTAAQEIEKLLSYVNRERPVEVDDVQLLTPDAGEGNVFKMVDAIGMQNGPLALRMLHQLLESEDPFRLFGMIVRQFRLLLLTRELLDSGNNPTEIARQLKTHPFIVQKLMGQVRNFSIVSLEKIYEELLDVDEAIKTGKIPIEVALDTLITSLSL